MLSKIKNIFSNQYWNFTLLVVSLLIVPALLQKGMFLDGITYASIANNLANGLGSFFKLHYSATMYPVFYEHPPFAIWVQSFFFLIFGENFWVEKIFSLFTGILTAIGLLKLFNFFFKEIKYNWFIVLVWGTIPLVFWGYNNNLLENVLNACCVFSIYYQLMYFRKNNYLYVFLASILILFSFLSKGLVGLFPLVVPFIYYITVEKNIKKLIISNLLLLILSGVCFLVIIFVFPELKENLINYFNSQLIPALEGKREITTTNRFKVLFRLFNELIAPLSILVLSLIFIKSKEFSYKKESLFFILIGLSASLPLIVSLKQRGFYLIPSIPYFILGISFIVIPLLANKFEKYKNNNILKVINSVLALGLIIWIFNFDGYFRDKQKLSDIEKVSELVDRGTVISSSKKVRRNWQVIAYFARLKNISLTDKTKENFLLIEKGNAPLEMYNGSYSKLNLDLEMFELYKLK